MKGSIGLKDNFNFLVCLVHNLCCACAGVNMSLLSKVMSPRLSRGVFNCGLLSTEAGTLARALADGLITMAGKGGVQHLANLTMIPALLLVVYTTIYTWTGYYSLYWWFFHGLLATYLCLGALFPGSSTPLSTCHEHKRLCRPKAGRRSSFQEIPSLKKLFTLCPLLAPLTESKLQLWERKLK